MNDKMNKAPGTRYRKVDLHLHTPTSKCYKDKNVKADEIISEAIAKGLDAVAITDHNDIGNIEAIQCAARGKDICVFPGIEITAAGGHVLAIFDRNYPITNLNDLLPKVGIDMDKRGREDAIGYDFEKVISEVHNAGGIAISAHANSDSGLLQNPQGSYKLKIFKRNDLFALELASRDDIEKFSQGKIPKYPPKPCIQSSDAHTLSEIGQRFTYLKMDVVSLEGIRQAFLDYEVKIRFEWDNIQIAHPYIKELRITQGFFGAVSFEFHPNLNCLIGGKNVGKSTIVEFLRYCFDDISGFRDLREDTLGKVTKLIGPGGHISIIYIDENGEELIIKRNIVDPEMGYEEFPVIKFLSGDDAIISSKPIFFSQGEIFRVASSTTAQIELVDRYIQLEQENNEEEILMDTLRANSAKLIEVENKLSKLEAELNNTETGKLALKTQYEKLEKALNEPIFTEFPKWESESRFLDSITIGIDNLKTRIKELFEQIDIDNLFHQTLDATSPNYSLLEPLMQVKESMKKENECLLKEFGDRLEESKKYVQNVKNSWDPLFAEKRSEHENAIKDLGEKLIRDAQARLRSLRGKIDELKSKEKEAKSLKGKLAGLKSDRFKLLEGLKKVREVRFRKRLVKVKEWEDIFSGQIKIMIIPSGDRKDYIEKLKGLLTGSYIQDRDIEKIAKAVDPDDLVVAVKNNQLDVLIKDSGLNRDLIKRLVEHLRGIRPNELYELEIVKLFDFPDIRFEVEPGKEKPLSELSVGTKSTVIISLAMIEGIAPLVIDQPEESLDTQFIFDQIVKKLRREKEKRQFIFTTYNPNIVVSADAELNFVLSATAEKGQIQSAGGVDRFDTNKLILLHLEGGKDAFKLRSQKYITE